MPPPRITFRQAAIGSAIFLAVWYACLGIVTAAIILIARIPWPVARDFLSARRTVLAAGVIGPMGLTVILWIHALNGWAQSAIERRWPEGEKLRRRKDEGKE